MSAPVIGLSTYGRDEKGRFTLYGEYVDAVRAAGGIPVLLPPGERRLGAWLETVDALLLAGGGDLDPVRYDGVRPGTLYDVDEERDASELELVDRAVVSDLPLLCVCRGLQVLNVARGGTLIEHLPDEVGEAVAHRSPERAPVRHPVTVAAGSLLARAMGTRHASPCSWHHQAVRELGRGLVPVAHAPDGVVEAVELDGRSELLAVQWHPELSFQEDPDQLGIFRTLVDWARARRERHSEDG